MRDQGALNSLISYLNEDSTNLSSKFDAIVTLSTLLSNNPKNQELFRQMDGYRILQFKFERIKFQSYDLKKQFLTVIFCFVFFFFLRNLNYIH